jgi:hypothetical protein
VAQENKRERSLRMLGLPEDARYDGARPQEVEAALGDAGFDCWGVEPPECVHMRGFS